MVFFSYRTNTETKQESPADDQFWKFSRQYSILVTLATSGHKFQALLYIPMYQLCLVKQT